MYGLLRAFKDPIEYGFAVGRVKVLESQLLSHQRVERLMGSKDISEALKILSETSYGQFFENIVSSTDIDRALENFLSDAYSFLKESCSNKNIIRFFLLRYDFYNLKVLIKIKYFNGDIKSLLSSLGDLDIERAERLIVKGESIELPSIYQKAVSEAISEFEKIKDPLMIDIVLDKHLYNQMTYLSLYEKREFLVDFVKAMIDVSNLKIFLRGKILGKDRDYFIRALFEEGRIPKEFFISLVSQSREVIINKLRATPYYDFINEKFLSEHSLEALSIFDKIGDNFLISIAKKTKRISLGVEPVVGYVFAKENEAKTLRIILTGKANNLSSKTIKGRLRELYV
ncbi:MAG: V-type ATP synthase subunit C [Actinobacteria bacterium]|nr:V-type ATP synthase subunit C [Actinomycetota bacterium]